MANTSRPDHLPNLRPDGKPPHPSWLPKQRRGTTPQMIGRYPDYDVLETADKWDAATRKVVLARLERNVPLLLFTLGYLAVVLVPIDFGWGRNWDIHTTFLPQQIIDGVILLAGAAGFALARRRQR